MAIAMPTEAEPVRVVQGDCLDVLRSLPDGCVDAVITDPPYGIDGGRGGDAKDFGKGKYRGDWRDDEDYIRAVVVPAMKECRRISPVVVVTPGVRCMHLYPQASDVGCFWTPAAATHGPWGFTTFQPILYYGRDWRAGRGALPSGRVVTESAEKNGHPCPKPLRAWQWLVDKSCLPGGLILDPFGGSGTTAVAALHEGRRCLIIEKDPTYCDIIRRRVAEAQGVGKGSFLAPDAGFADLF
jgi:site-specific DNA-methyltransferase (adenine-specific)